jgi:hypothetical protein
MTSTEHFTIMENTIYSAGCEYLTNFVRGNVREIKKQLSFGSFHELKNITTHNNIQYLACLICSRHLN